MNRRLGVALAAFVLWTAITVIGGNITTGGEVTKGRASHRRPCSKIQRTARRDQREGAACLYVRLSRVDGFG
jgi:hypothetical protein